MEILEYTTETTTSYHNPDDDKNDCIETVSLSSADITIDSVRKQFKAIKDSRIWEGKTYTNNTIQYNPLLIDICKLEDKIECVEKAIQSLFTEGDTVSLHDDMDKTQNIIAAIEKSKQQSHNTLSYEVASPTQTLAASQLENEVIEVRNALDTLRCVIIRLEEMCDGKSMAALLNEMEKITTILNPAYLLKMELDYPSLLRQFVRNIQKKTIATVKEDQITVIDNAAKSIINGMKDINKLVLQLHNRRRELEQWDSLLVDIASLERLQNQCIQTLKQDQEVLKNLQDNIVQSTIQLQKNIEFLKNRN